MWVVLWHANWNSTGQSGSVFPAGATADQVTATSPTAIFLPAAGWRNTRGVLNQANVAGFHWSNSPGIAATAAWRLRHENPPLGNPPVMSVGRAYGFSIRCVQDI